MIKFIHPLRKTGIRQRLVNSRSLRSALFTFILTGSIVFIILILTNYIDNATLPSGEGNRSLHISLQNINPVVEITETFRLADTNWYLNIARNGYEVESFNTDKQRNWAFFPLFPLLLRAVSCITGEYILSGIVLSNLCFLTGLILVYKTAIEFGFDESIASRSIFYLAIFPTSYFFSLPITESLFLFLTAGSFYAAKRERWWVAGLFGALASATRITGILLLPALIILYFLTYRRNWILKDLIWLCLIPSGLLSFMGYLYTITGNPLAFMDIQVTWKRGAGFFLTPLLSHLRHPLEIADSWDFRILNFFAALIALILSIVLIKRRQFALAAYLLIFEITSLSSILLQSQARYTMVIFPVFIASAFFGENQRIDQTIRTVSLVLLSLMTVMFALNFEIALS